MTRKRDSNRKAGSHGDSLREYASSFASLGGKARAKKLSPEQRREIARKAVLARWARAKGKRA